MKIQDVIQLIEEFAPLSFQESFDNSGIQVGNSQLDCTGCLITFDFTEEIIDEAIRKNCNIIIGHHPIIFSGLKKITGKNMVERVVMKAIQNNIVLYAAHTNLDVVQDGINGKICEKLNLENYHVLAPTKTDLVKLVCFVPTDYAENVRSAIFEAGAGHIGDYDCCSFNIKGEGTFRANENSTPFVGEIGKIHHENEIRIETVLPAFLQNVVVKKMIHAHPYEEVAYDIYPLKNKYDKIGLGMVGQLSESMDEKDFLDKLKTSFNASCIRHTNLLGRKVKKVAVCGGSGSSFLKDAIKAGADFYVSGDFKYHQFFDAENKIVIADVGHFETEQFAKEIFYDLLTKNLANFAIHLSEINTNPINYY